jgi:hypothetical protein
MSRENVEIVRRSFERISEGRPAWELYAEDFQLVNLPDAAERTELCTCSRSP